MPRLETEMPEKLLWTLWRTRWEDQAADLTLNRRAQDGKGPVLTAYNVLGDPEAVSKGMAKDSQLHSLVTDCHRSL